MTTGTLRGAAYAARVLSVSLGLVLSHGAAFPQWAQAQSAASQTSAAKSAAAQPAAVKPAAEQSGEAKPTEASAVAPEALTEAKAHFSNGVELLQATPPSYQDAFRQFQLAYEKSGGSWKVLGNLGLCALKLERDGEALSYYEQYLTKGAAEIDPGERSAIERDLLLVRGNMASVTVRSLKPNTKLMVTRKGSEVPAQTYVLAEGENQLGLRAGELTLVAVSGEARESWEAVLAPADVVKHEFAFALPKPVPVVVAAPVQPVAPPPPSETSSSGLRGVQVAGIVTGSVGVLAVVGGAIFGVMAKDAESEAAAQCIGTICPEDTANDFQSASDMATLSNVFFISGGVLVATGVTLVLVGGKKSENPAAARLEISPRASTGFVGFSAFGRF